MADETNDEPKGQLYHLATLRKADPFKQAPPKDAVGSHAYEPEDEFTQWYVGGQANGQLLMPPYLPASLVRLCQENNTLGPCIDAMVTNCDGTGFDFEADDNEANDREDDSKIDALKEFFHEPWPGESFLTQRQELRRDLERTGNAYLEVLRNVVGEVIFLRRVDAKMMRIVKLDTAVPVEKTIKRGGVELKVTVMVRERRFVQLLNGITLVYFKEFGASRDLDKKTGNWAQPGQQLDASLRASEIIHFTVNIDAHTPYGVPRWVGQMPSVLGSRKAEEFNLDFFDNGGIPPALIILEGGALVPDTRKALENKVVFGPAKDKNRIQILEVQATGGSMDKVATARVTVERFGDAGSQDSMFEKYDDKCEVRVRRAFRLPPIFVGAAQDYAFASAVASYTVAEAQVFKPERDEFDEIISMKLLPALGFAGYRMKSKPLVIEDATLKLQGIETAISTQAVDMEDVIGEINDATGTNLKFKEPPAPAPMILDAAGKPMPAVTHGTTDKGAPAPSTPKGPGTGGSAKAPQLPKVPGVNAPQKLQKALSEGTIALAVDAMGDLRRRDMVALAKDLDLARGLTPEGQESFRKACAELQFVNPDVDLDGLAALMGRTIGVMTCDHQHH